MAGAISSEIYVRGRTLLGIMLMLALIAPAWAQQDAPEAEEVPRVEAGEDQRLPDASVTRHEIAFEERTLRFTAIAGAITLTGARGQAEAEIGFVAYVRDSDDAAARPVTFAVNGGPGAASAYLHLGVLGPWRLPVGVDNIVPSQSVELLANAETWLDFTDLVFIDPVGTGFSRLVEDSDRLRRRYLSVDGDIEALADFVTRWLRDNARVTSPKYFIGESYGGFRGPRLADTLQTDHGVALSGMTLLSPVLDFGWRRQPAHSPLPHASLLPSLAAAGMERTSGEISLQDLRVVEDYAAGDYIVDLLRGPQDAAAVARITERVAEFTGLEAGVVERYAGRIDMQSFVREIGREEDRIASIYDTGVTGDDPTPERPFGRARDPVLDGLTAPLTSAMLAHYQDTLEWLPERRYVLLNSRTNRAWNWGNGRTPPHAVTALRRVLALDREFQLLVVHGYTDLVTPYFESGLILRQLRDFGPGERVRQKTYPGGHMFYTRDEARRAFRDDAMEMYRPVD
jgi:carboxypeptidase C (cathepsin A)